MSLANFNPVAIDHSYLDRLAVRATAVREVAYAEHAAVSAAGYTVYTLRPYSRRGETVYVHPQSGLPRYGNRLDWSAVEPHVLTIERALAEGLCSEEHVERLDAAKAALSHAVAACREVEDEYRRRPWSRYWLVTSSDGHVHRSTCCSTCNKGRSATGFALVPYLSGSTSADAVADLGPALCSVCFPEAPVESREQSRVSARVALSLAEEGVEAFQRARAAAASRRAARCPGTGKPGLVPVVADGTPSHTAAYIRKRTVQCPQCNARLAARGQSKNVPPHKPT
jgi:hypothetical protein